MTLRSPTLQMLLNVLERPESRLKPSLSRRKGSHEISITQQGQKGRLRSAQRAACFLDLPDLCDSCRDRDLRGDWRTVNCSLKQLAAVFQIKIVFEEGMSNEAIQ